MGAAAGQGVSVAPARACVLLQRSLGHGASGTAMDKDYRAGGNPWSSRAIATGR